MQTRKINTALGLLLLLITAQYGAVIHELSHETRFSAEVRVDSGQFAEKTCALCLAFAQVVNPASHSIHVLPSFRAESVLSAEPRYPAIATKVPTPRSRGPPAMS